MGRTLGVAQWRNVKLLAAILAVALCCTGEAISDNKWTFGTEFDLLPFLNHGYYVSAVVGKGRLRGQQAGDLGSGCRRLLQGRFLSLVGRLWLRALEWRCDREGLRCPGELPD